MLDEWIRNVVDKTDSDVGKGSKLKKQVIIIAVCLGLLALIWPAARVDRSPKTAVSGTSADSTELPARLAMEKELQSILSSVEGAGQVQVSLTLLSDGAKTYALNTKEEKRRTDESERGGAKRQIEEESQVNDVAVLGDNALLVEQSAPRVLGVLVVAEGARDAVIQEQMTDIASTLLNISPHQVRVVAAEVKQE